MGSCWTKEVDYDDDHHHEAELASGNVHLITTMEEWDVMLSEASKDGKIELSSSWGISATPTFFFLKEKKTIDKLVGANKEELHKKLALVTTHHDSQTNPN
ncbi:hypothetical protein F8388_018185 [Cannabis sativa]|uniref:Thioredoxin domain-containing protein n=1 Tax=Cannabis sativa TaxID=3483 RepID=A0A7J6GAT5_CANSA|nr:hypothetical protein F8388_018185 [Cannabis sativa]